MVSGRRSRLLPLLRWLQNGGDCFFPLAACVVHTQGSALESSWSPCDSLASSEYHDGLESKSRECKSIDQIDLVVTALRMFLLLMCTRLFFSRGGARHNA